MKKDKYIIRQKYLLLVTITICIIFIIFIQLNHNNVGGSSTPTKTNTRVLENLYLYDGDINNPINTPDDFYTENYVWITGVLPDDLNLSDSLAFYTIHQNVSVTVADGDNRETIYEFKRNESDLSFGKTPGHAFNIINDLYNYKGQEITIFLYSPYGINESTVPEFIIGPTDHIIAAESGRSMLVLSASIAIFLLGFALITIWIVLRKYILKDNLTLVYSGCFSIFVAIWTANEQPILSYVLNNSIITAYVSFISLMLVPIGFILFFREVCQTKYNKIWHTALFINYVNLFVTIILQCLNIADFKECLPFNQTIILLSVVTIFIYSTFIVFKQRTTSGYINFISITCLYIGYFLYLYKFYTNELYELYYGSLFVIIYIFANIYLYAQKSVQAMLKSDRAEFYENLAYKDSLTDLLNRLAYDTAIASVDVKKSSYIIVIFDLNNLKHFNDVYGHNIGDTYIKDSSSLIQEAFKNLGNLYRIGGDEFCIIMKDKGIFEYETATRRLDTLMYNYNKVSDVLKINIAYGYALYDSKIDRDIYETRNRADAMMYQKKFLMKQQQNGIIS